MTDDSENKSERALRALAARRAAASDAQREAATAKRHDRGGRTARENLAALVDPDSFVAYGELAVAAQRQRRELDDLIANTSGDGVITGLATVNATLFGNAASRVAVVINDYSVLAGTQGFYHHKKIDRMLELADREQLPVIMYTEGGGGRPGDTDVTTQVTGLDVPTFARWARLAGRVPRIVVNHGYCFAGNALLFGCADLRIATRASSIGMAGPAMIEAGGLGAFKATEIGPIAMHAAQGTVDVLVDDEAAATAQARALVGFLQGAIAAGEAADPEPLRESLPADRRFTYKVRPIIERVVDTGSFMELGHDYARAMITGLCRIAGRAVGVIANDNQSLAGAIDAAAADKASRFLRFCDTNGLPVVSFVDTPGFMVGPDSEAEAATRHMSEMFLAGVSLSVPLVAIVLRKAYGLGAMAMAGGGFSEPFCAAAWPTGEFGAMGLEGAVRLGFRKELDAVDDDAERDALFERLVAQMYDRGSAMEVASVLEIDRVIDPAETRALIEAALR
ncbi:MAG: carboxyl transferase domain-containing protein [Pseudomonadota bacterium]